MAPVFFRGGVLFDEDVGARGLRPNRSLDRYTGPKLTEPRILGNQLDGDGVDDAAVTLVTNTGGSGSFVQLVAVVNQSGEPSPNASASLGDRVRVEAIRIAELQIEIDLVVHGPSDPLCCPSMSVTRIYILEDSNLILLEELPG